MEDGRRALKILTKRPLGRPWCRWEDNIRMDLKEKVSNTKNLVDSGLLESLCECGIEPLGFIIYGVSKQNDVFFLSITLYLVGLVVSMFHY